MQNIRSAIIAHLFLPYETAFVFRVIGFERHVHNRKTYNVLIYCLDSLNNKCYICTESEQIVSRKAITFFEDKLEKAGFFRVHRSYLVNMRKVRSFDKSKIELINGEKIDISARKYAAFCKEYIKLK